MSEWSLERMGESCSIRCGSGGSQRVFVFDSFYDVNAGGASPGAMLLADKRSKFLAYVERQLPISKSRC
jgi:hypothetical protein